MGVKNRSAIVIGAVACALAGAAHAGRGISFNFSSDTGSGSTSAFRWDGGDAGEFGPRGTMLAAMRYAANESGGSVFESIGFAGTGVNIYLVDFTRNETFMDAGLTMFVMWGNGEGVDSFAGSISASPIVNEGEDGNFTAGIPEVFALGPGVSIREIGPLTIDIDVNGSETPVGFAISNMQTLPNLRFNQNFTLVRAINSLGIYGMGEGQVWAGVDDDENDAIFTDGVVIIVPAPPAGLAMLVGLVGFRTRRRR